MALAALTGVLALAAGLTACTASGSSTATATARATTTPVTGTETLSGKLTGSAAISDILVFHLRLTGPVGTTATIRLGTEVPEKYESYTIHTAVGDLAVTLASAGTSTGGLKSTTTCLYVRTMAVPFAVDGASSTGVFAGATGTGTAVVVISADDPKLSDRTCNTSSDALPSATTAAATFAATIKLTVRR
jgi:hypothetical protein